MYQVSLFINTWSKTPTTITFEDFFAMVRNGHWKVPTEGHRSCLAKDRKHDAQTIKDSMACVIPAGICKNGHAKNNLTSLSLALCIDIDHTDEQTKDIFVRACLLEYVLGAFISISGRGVKLFIRIDIDGVNDYPAIYEATAKLVSTVLGVENDREMPRISPIPASDHTTRTHTTTVTQRPSTTFCRTVHSLRASPTLPSLPLPVPPALPPLSPTDIRLRCRITGFPPLPSYSPTSPSTLPQRATGTEPFSGSAALPANAASTVTN